jgi:hypothetical protein
LIFTSYFLMYGLTLLVKFKNNKYGNNIRYLYWLFFTTIHIYYNKNY